MQQDKIILSCQKISKSFDGVIGSDNGEIEILREINFVIHSGEKIGLVGLNGSGKSTLMKILVGELEKDSGEIQLNRNLRIKYFPQIIIPESEQQHLSGGELAKRVLEPILSSDASLFLLDEPTNNLDDDGLRRLEDFIKKSSASFLIISHDRKFLDNTISRILEIDIHTKTIKNYGGNYTQYYEQKQSDIKKQWTDYENSEKRQKKLQNELQQKTEWTDKINAKINSIKRLPIHEKEKPDNTILRDRMAKMSGRVKVVKNKIEKETKDKLKRPSVEPELEIIFETEQGSDKVFEIKNVTKHFRNKILDFPNIEILYGDRIHLIGKNGSGKSNLIKLLLEKIEQDGGEIIRGKNVYVGYIPQSRRDESDQIKTYDFFETNTKLSRNEIYYIASKFRLSKEDLEKQLSDLSPGEYSRLLIAILIAQKPNCIILDEPTNHLDLEVCEELEKGLQGFTGTLIVASHDRYFCQKINFNKEVKLATKPVK